MTALPYLTLRNFLIWIGAWTAIGVAVMGEDKLQAIGQYARISERTLHEIALMGGFAGIVIGAKLFHHKTSKPSFWPPVGAAVVLWAALSSLLLYYGYLRIAI